MPTFQEVYHDPEFWKLEPDVQIAVLSKIDEEYKQLDKDTQRAVVTFDPEGSGYDYRTAFGIIEKFPLTSPKPEKYVGDVVGNKDGSESFETWVWHPEEKNYFRHFASLDPRTGRVLKGKKHKTFNLTEEIEKDLGSKIEKGEDGYYHAVPDMAADTNLMFIGEETQPRKPSLDEPIPPEMIKGKNALGGLEAGWSTFTGLLLFTPSAIALAAGGPGYGEKMAEFMGRLAYEPRTELGKEFTGQINKVFEKTFGVAEEFMTKHFTELTDEKKHPFLSRMYKNYIHVARTVNPLLHATLSNPENNDPHEREWFSRASFQMSLLLAAPAVHKATNAKVGKIVNKLKGREAQVNFDKVMKTALKLHREQNLTTSDAVLTAFEKELGVQLGKQENLIGKLAKDPEIIKKVHETALGYLQGDAKAPKYIDITKKDVERVLEAKEPPPDVGVVIDKTKKKSPELKVPVDKLTDKQLEQRAKSKSPHVDAYKAEIERRKKAQEKPAEVEPTQEKPGEEKPTEPPKAEQEGEKLYREAVRKEFDKTREDISKGVLKSDEGLKPINPKKYGISIKRAKEIVREVAEEVKAEIRKPKVSPKPVEAPVQVEPVPTTTAKPGKLEKPPVEEYQKKADELGIKFNGMQEQVGGKPPLPVFTDIAETKSTFTLKPGETVEQALERLRKPFKKTKVTKKPAEAPTLGPAERPPRPPKAPKIGKEISFSKPEALHFIKARYSKYGLTSTESTSLLKKMVEDRKASGKPPWKNIHEFQEYLEELERAQDAVGKAENVLKGMRPEKEPEIMASRVQGEEAALPTIKTKFTLDKTNTLPTLLKNIANQNPSRTMIYELMQNSLDAFCSMLKGEGKVDITITHPSFSKSKQLELTFSDNGRGMSPEEIKEFFLVGGSVGKSGVDTRGGYGLAKIALLLIPESVDLVTVRDGIRSMVHVTRDQIYNGEIEIEPFKTKEPNGTSFKAILPTEFQRWELTTDIIRSAINEVMYGTYTDATVSLFLGDKDGKNFIRKYDPRDVSKEPTKLNSKSFSLYGSDFTIHVLKTDPYGWSSHGNNYYAAKGIVTNKGLMLDMRGDFFSQIVRFKPDFKFVVDFTKTPEPRHPDYPFLNNRTELVKEFAEEIKTFVKDSIREISEELVEKKGSGFQEMLKRSPEFNGVKVLIPLYAKEIYQKTVDLISEYSDVIGDIAGLTREFLDFLEMSGEPKANFHLTVDPTVYGYKTNPNVTGVNLYAINPFALSDKIANSPNFRSALESTGNKTKLQADSMVHTIVHEYAHGKVFDHTEMFTSELARLTVVLGHDTLHYLATRMEEFYVKHADRIKIAGDHFDSLRESGAGLQESFESSSVGSYVRGGKEGLRRLEEALKDRERERAEQGEVRAKGKQEIEQISSSPKRLKDVLRGSESTVLKKFTPFIDGIEKAINDMRRKAESGSEGPIKVWDTHKGGYRTLEGRGIKEGDYHAIEEFIREVEDLVKSKAEELPINERRALNEALLDLKSYALRDFRLGESARLRGINNQTPGIYKAVDEFRKLVAETQPIPPVERVFMRDGDVIITLKPERVPYEVIRKFVEELFKGVDNYAGFATGFSLSEGVRILNGTHVRLHGVTLKSAERILGSLSTEKLESIEATIASKVGPVEPDTPIDNFLKKHEQTVEKQVQNKKQRGAITIGTPSQRASAKAKYKFHDQKLKEVLEVTEHPSSLRGKLNSFIADFSKGVKEMLVEKYNVIDHPQYRNDARLIKDMGLDAATTTDQLLWTVVAPLTRKQYKLFKWAVSLRDFLETAKEGKLLPQDVKLDVVEKELKSMEKFIANHEPSVKDAIVRHEDLMKAVADDLVARGKMSQESVREHYYPHVVIDYHAPWMDLAALPKKAQIPWRSYTKKRIGSPRDIDMNYIEVMYNHLTRVFADNAFEDWLNNMMVKHDVLSRMTKAQRKQVLGGRNTSVAGKIYTINGKKYKGFQPRPGNAFYKALSVNEGLWQEAVTSNLTTQELMDLIGPKGGEPIREILAVGKKRKSFLLPIEIADDLIRFRASGSPPRLLIGATAAVGVWKRMVLDFAGLPFQMFNFVGDGVNLFKTDPGAFTKLFQTMDIAFLKEGKEYKLSPEVQKLLRDAREQRVDTTYFLRETGIVPAGKVLSKFQNPALKYNPLNIFMKLFEDLSIKRERTLRLAKFFKDMERIKNGKDIVAREIDVRGLTPLEAAGKVAREFTVDYGNVPRQYATLMRGLLFPFCTFYDYNARNWYNYVTKHPGNFMLKFGGPYAALWTLNNTGEAREIEKNLQDHWLFIPHYNTRFKTSDGKPIIVAFDLPFNMAARFVGLDRIGGNITRVIAGDMTWKEAAIQQLKDTGMGAPHQIMALANPVVGIMKGIHTGRHPFFNTPIVPPMYQNTDQEWKYWADFIASSIIAPYGQYLSASRMKEPGGAFFNWLIGGPFSWKRALGIREVDLNQGRRQREYRKEKKYERIMKSTLADLHDSYVKQEVYGDTKAFNEALDRMYKSDIHPSKEQIFNVTNDWDTLIEIDTKILQNLSINDPIADDYKRRIAWYQQNKWLTHATENTPKAIRGHVWEDVLRIFDKILGKKPTIVPLKEIEKEKK